MRNINEPAQYRPPKVRIKEGFCQAEPSIRSFAFSKLEELPYFLLREAHLPDLPPYFSFTGKASALNGAALVVSGWGSGMNDGREVRVGWTY